MKRFLSIEINEESEFSHSVEIKSCGKFPDLCAMAAESMYALNSQFNEKIPGDLKNLFWNTVVDAVGKKLLEESVR